MTPFSVVTMPWSGEHRGFVVETFFKNNDSVVATQRAFRKRFGLTRHDRVPDAKTIRKWITSVRATGSALPKKPAGRPKSVRTPENIAAVRVSIEQSPSRSARKHAAALGISPRTVRRILHSDLHLHPYKLMVVQELSPQDWMKRTDASNAILTSVQPDTILWSSDEAHFHLSGSVNKQNFRYWAAENPRELHQRPLPRAAACFRAERDGDCSMDTLTAAMFSGVLTLLGRPAGFLGSADPVALTLVIHFLMVLASGTLS